MKQDQKMRLVGKVLVGIIVIVLLVAVMQNLALYGFSGKTYYASIVPPGGAYSTSLLPAYEAVNVDTCRHTFITDPLPGRMISDNCDRYYGDIDQRYIYYWGPGAFMYR